MFTARHHIKLAEELKHSMDICMNTNDVFATDMAVRESRRQGVVIAAQQIAFMLRQDNDRFDYDVFMKACGML